MEPDVFPAEGAAIASALTRLRKHEQGWAEHATKVGRTIEKRCQQVASGDLSMVEEMLVSSASSMMTLSNKLLERAGLTDRWDFESEYIRLAIASQNQMVKTLKALAEVKNPKRAMFVKQLNQLHLEAPTNAAMDARGQIEAGPGYPPMETLETQHRAKDRAG